MWPARLHLLLSALALASCHLIFPHQPPEPPGRSDASLSADRSVEARAHDLPAPVDRMLPEKALPPDLPPDQKPLPDKALPPDKHSPDLWPPCPEAQTLNESAPTCGQQCTSSSGDLDCDGLTDAKLDPQPSCNRLVFSDPFLGSPALSGKWTTAGGLTWSCGSLTLAPGASITLVPAIATPKTLVEVKLKLGITVSGNWSVNIRVGKASGSDCYCDCAIWVDGGYQPLGGLHFNQHGCANLGDWTSGKSLATPKDQTYLLRTWTDGVKQYCMVLNADGSSPITGYPLPLAFGGPAAQQGAITVSASARSVILDHVRVFQFN